MVTERSIINFLIWSIGLIASPWLAASAILGNLTPIYTVIGLTLVAFVFGAARDNIAVAPFIAMGCAGRFNMLPLKFSPVDLAVLLLLTYYVIVYLALRRQRMRTGQLLIFVPILIIAAIIIYNEHDFGIRGMGSGREGGRKAFFIIAAAVAYLCGVSVNGPSPRVLSLTPIFCAIGSALFAIPYIVTTYVPSLAPLVYQISDNINATAYTSDLMNSGELVRNSGQATIGSVIMACLLAYFPITTWWRPTRWWIFIVALGCTVLVISSGFRNNLAAFGLMISISASCYITWRAILIIPLAMLGVMLLILAQNNNIVHLPNAAQRTLSFLPGDWDADVVESAKSSNDFRRNIIRIYLDEYASAHPWIGNGLSYDSAKFEEYTFMTKYHETLDGYYEGEEFIVSKQFHTGWVGMYDAVGILGSICFISLFVTLLVQMGRNIYQKSVNRRSILFPLKVWTFASLVVQFIVFFFLFGDIASTFPSLCYTSIIWFHLTRVESGLQLPATVRQVQFKTVGSALTMPAR